MWWLLVFALLVPLKSHAEEGANRFFDKEDGYFDMSEHLLNYQGFLPVPILITEPAIDYGVGMGALWFEESMSEAQQRSLKESGRPAPPTIGALFGFKSGNDSWGGGGAYFMPLDGDRYRYLGALGKIKMNLDFFTPTGRSSSYQLEGEGLVQQFLIRMGDTPWFMGPRYVYFQTESEFSQKRPNGISDHELDLDIGQFTLVADYDSRDNIFTPNRGTFIEMEFNLVREWLAASVNYEGVNLRGYHYQPLFDEQLIVGARVDSRNVSDEAPFFALPYLSLRGVPVMRYQDSSTLVAETELRWNLNKRWALVGFVGGGKAFGKLSDWQEAETVVAGGTGFRYLVARKLGIYAGVDIARGPEEGAIYIQVGSAWR